MWGEEPVHPQHGDTEPGEYLPGDSDLCHCKHGKYIGYPGGPDYMCHWCEMGEEPPVYRYRVSLVIRHTDGTYSLTDPTREYRFEHLNECWKLPHFDPKTLEHMATDGLYPLIEEL